MNQECGPVRLDIRLAKPQPSSETSDSSGANSKATPNGGASAANFRHAPPKEALAKKKSGKRFFRKLEVVANTK